ncbi:P-loop containing nucleoside triphosphatehydrolases superfamily protein [Striga asiatica]|uniref:P-loop containing nucleoside triphosphatehydrolases superfamily protein n=1 Tax=Striga asiatica TaxID=4170 RepID=A0A5A7PZH9_STRAF|nr:P-loop containing nucleoside triphosphatehydrolases superfamily protein [Striga asiatica]
MRKEEGKRSQAEETSMIGQKAILYSRRLTLSRLGIITGARFTRRSRKTLGLEYAFGVRLTALYIGDLPSVLSSGWPVESILAVGLGSLSHQEMYNQANFQIRDGR